MMKKQNSKKNALPVWSFQVGKIAEFVAVC